MMVVPCYRGKLQFCRRAEAVKRYVCVCVERDGVMHAGLRRVMVCKMRTRMEETNKTSGENRENKIPQEKRDDRNVE